MFAKKKRKFERLVKKAIFVKKQNSTMNINGGLRFCLLPVHCHADEAENGQDR